MSKSPSVSGARPPAVWFPAVRAGTGADVFTERLAGELAARGIRTEITWLPLRAEYAPWTVPVPKPPDWANVAHVNTWFHPGFLPTHLPVVATIHHSVHDPELRPYKGFARAVYHRFWIAPNERRVLRRADRVIAVSRFVAKTAKRTLLDVPMQVIYNGVDTTRYRPGSRQWQPGEPFRLLYVGSWIKRKGVDLLAPIMCALGDEFELRYTGATGATKDKAAMPPNMRDVGRLSGDDEVIAAMQDADALLFPSRSEGFGLVAAEAMACGLPVITTRSSSLTEVVEDGSTGVLCPQDDVAAFATAVRELASARERRTRMAQAARRRTIERFSHNTMVDAYVDLYHRLVVS